MLFGTRLRARLNFILILLVLGGCFQSTTRDTDIASTQYLPQQPESQSLKSTNNLSQIKAVEDNLDNQNGNAWDYFVDSEHLALLASGSISENKTYQAELKRISDNQHYFDLISTNAQPFLKYIIQEIEDRDMPVFLALLPAIESSYRADVTSSWKAAGLWQFIPSTGRQFGLKQNWWYDGRRDVVASTHAALDYLKQLHDQFGDWSLALAAYNSGEGTVSRAIKKNMRQGKTTDYWSLDLPPETKQYIPRLLALSNVVSEPKKYGIKLPKISDELAISQVDTKGQIQLSRIAELANIDLEDLKKLNAAHSRWATDPDGPHKIVVPAELAERLKLGIERLDEDDRVTWRHHNIRRGESLSTIAQRYNISVSVLKTANKLKSSMIRTGKHLLVPDTRTQSSSQAIAKQSKKQPSSSDVVQNTSSELPALVDGNTYQIQSGDSLSVIAERFNVSLKEILQWNNINADHVLIPGKKLKIFIEQAAIETASL